MNRSLRAALAVVSAVVLATGGSQRPADAAPDGKTTTFEIGVGASLLRNLIKLSIDNGKADRSRREAEALMSSEQDPKLRFDHDGPGSARGMRTSILKELVKNSSLTARKRQDYEVLRACWNSVLAAPSAGADASKKPLLSYVKVTDPSAQPADPDCAMRNSIVNGFIGGLVDQYDSYVAFQNGQSLYQQIIDLRVGSHRAENTLRIRTIYVLGAVFIGYVPSVPAAATSAKDVFDSCFNKPDVFGCVGLIQAAEASAASDYRAAAACRFSRENWLPSYSAVVGTAASAINDGADFGAAPGC